MIRVLIVDDHAVVRTGLRLLLDAEKDIEVVGEAGNARDAVFEARSSKPDVILMDVVMPGASGIEATSAVLKESPETKVLVLSMQDDPMYVREAFAAGASGYVLKEAADDEVVSAVREVATGGRYVNPALGAKLVAAAATRDPSIPALLQVAWGDAFAEVVGSKAAAEQIIRAYEAGHRDFLLAYGWALSQPNALQLLSGQIAVLAEGYLGLPPGSGAPLVPLIEQGILIGGQLSAGFLAEIDATTTFVAGNMLAHGVTF